MTNWSPSKAMVFAAGLGKRMRPLTDDIPKPMVKLAHRPLIDHVLDRLVTVGIQEVIVNVHYRAEVLETHLASKSEPNIKISDERDLLLDTGGGVVKALPLLGDEPFIIHNSDSVWLDGVSDNFDRLISAWRSDDMDTLMLLASVTNCLGYAGRGDFAMSPNGQLTRRAEGRMAPFVFTGVSIAHPRLFVDAPTGAFSINRLWDRAINSGRAYGLRLDGYWMHVGTPEALREAEHVIENGLEVHDSE